MASHWGVYGLWRQAGLVVSIRKSRGPYTGMLDLPGGSPEPREEPEQTLARELAEECGVRLVAHGPWRPFALHVTRASDGASIDFHHRGLWARVDVAGPVRPVRDVEDVEAVELIDPAHRSPRTLSPLLRHALIDDLPPAAR